MKTQAFVGGFAVQISEIDLKKPMSNDTFAGLHETIDQHAVAIFRDQSLIDEQLVFFAGRFGKLETPLPFDQYGGEHKDITMLANVDENGNIIGTENKHGI